MDYKEKVIALLNSQELSKEKKERLEEIFPELKESEDERIRKHLVYHFQNKTKEEWNGMPVKDILAWLEKQGELIDKIVKRAMTEKQRVLLTETNGDANIDWDTRSLQDVKLLLEYGLDYIKKLEKQGEQKPDMVEPKFKIGDWIIFNEHHNSVYQVEKIQGLRYYLRHYTGGSLSVHIDNELIRPWTIQDAQAGDVLACPNDAGDRDVVFIFKNINSDEGWVFCFCASDANGCFCTNNDYVGNSNSTNISPATKEQRDLLFQKMKEAEYTFDFKKKELKKIEQLKQVWSEEDERMFESLNKLLNEASCYSCIEGVDKILSWIKFFKERYTWKPSDEQMKALHEATLEGEPVEALETLLLDLKKLKEE